MTDASRAALGAGTSYTAHPERADPRLMAVQLSTNLGWMEAAIPSLAGEPLSQNHPIGWLYVAARSESIRGEAWQSNSNS